MRTLGEGQATWIGAVGDRSGRLVVGSPGRARRPWMLCAWVILPVTLLAAPDTGSRERQAFQADALGLRGESARGGDWQEPGGDPRWESDTHRHRWYPRRGYRLYSPYATPWYAPPTVPYKHELYPPPVAYESRLGLMYNYPYAWQMGIQMPVETDPLDLPDLPPYRGVVGVAKAALAELSNATAGSRPPGIPEEREAVRLMRQGEYRLAGQLLTRGFARNDHPRYSLLLAEVFFALGKFDHSELLLRHAFVRGEDSSPGADVVEPVGDSLSGDVHKHFRSEKGFEARLTELVESGEHPALAAYFLLFSGEEERGFKLLKKDLAGSPGDPLLSGIYRQYLRRQF